MPDQRLRMIAELQDRVSAPLRRMSAGFSEFTHAARQAPEGFLKLDKSALGAEKRLALSQRLIKQMPRELKALSTEVTRLVPGVGSLTGELGAFTIGAGTAVGAAAAFGVALSETTKKASEFAEQMRNLKFTARETGFSETQLKQLETVGERVGLTKEQVQAGARGFSDSMLQMQKHVAAFTQQLYALGPGAVAFAQPLQRLANSGASSAEEFEKLLEIFEQIKKAHPGAEGEQLARRFAQAFQVPAEFTRLGPQFQRLLRDLDKFGFDPKRIEEATKAEDQFNAAIWETKSRLDIIGTAIQTQLLKPTTELVGEFNKLLGQKSFADWLLGPGGQVTKTINDINEMIRSLNAAVEGFKSTQQAAPGWLERAAKPHPGLLDRWFGTKPPVPLPPLAGPFAPAAPPPGVVPAPAAAPPPAAAAPPAPPREQFGPPMPRRQDYQGWPAEVPKYQHGIANVPRDQLAFLHRGERVIPAGGRFGGIDLRGFGEQGKDAVADPRVRQQQARVWEAYWRAFGDVGAETAIAGARAALAAAARGLGQGGAGAGPPPGVAPTGGAGMGPGGAGIPGVLGKLLGGGAGGAGGVPFGLGGGDGGQGIAGLMGGAPGGPGGPLGGLGGLGLLGGMLGGRGRGGLGGILGGLMRRGLGGLRGAGGVPFGLGGGGGAPRGAAPPGAPPGGPGGPGGVTRQWDIPSIPPGAGGMIADRLKGAGIALPPELDAKIRGGQAITGGDLSRLPQGDLDKAGKMLGRPLYHDVPAAGPGQGPGAAGRRGLAQRLGIDRGSSGLERVADAIGKQEGYGKRGAIPTQYFNPGDLKFGPFARAHGATGAGRGGHAIFPDFATGRRALTDLLQTKGGGQSLAQIGKWWAGDPAWAAGVAKAAGVRPDYVPAPRRIVGAGGGARPGVSPRTWRPGDGVRDNSGKALDQQTLAQVEQMAARHDVQGMHRFVRSQGYNIDRNWCGELAGSFAKASGLKPPANAEVASSWHRWAQSMSPADINKPGHPFGSMYATYWHARYGAGKGQLLRPGETGGHVMTVMPGTFDPRARTAEMIGPEGKTTRNISDLDFRFAGAPPEIRERLGQPSDPAAAAKAMALREQGYGMGGDKVDRGEIDSARREVNGALTHKVEGTGHLTVDVNAPPSTRVRSRAGGLFKQTNVSRNVQMQPTTSGPDQHTSSFAFSP